MRIIGAGLAGLLAAHAWPQARVLEAAPGPAASHHALLRFRTDAVARATGIDFRTVTVRKGIWHEGNFVQPNIQLANLYSHKLFERFVGERSIWSLEPVQRYIAPESFYDQLIETVGSRIQWGEQFDFKQFGEGEIVVSTAPMPVTLKAVGMTGLDLEFKRAPITVDRYRLNGADVHQTVYFPDPETPVYRASITGSLLIVESIVAYNHHRACSSRSRLEDVMDAFALDVPDPIEPLDTVEQKYGKIIPLPDEERKALLFRLTQEHGVFSLGRFATWRNALLDDVINDIAVIRKLIKAKGYERHLHFS